MSKWHRHGDPKDLDRNFEHAHGEGDNAHDHRDVSAQAEYLAYMGATDGLGDPAVAASEVRDSVREDADNRDA